MKLVIVESPSKAKTIKKYLGKGYEVLASRGHVVDLPKSKLGVEPEKDFKASYVVTNRKKLKELKDAYSDAEELILAVDLDREGEAIGWHVAQKLGAITPSGKNKDGKAIKRIVFSEITKNAVNNAIENPRNINLDLVNAQQARRILDRLVGYKLSPILWKKIMFGLSAGRVQSVALRLVVEKEEERNKFNPEEYWSLEVFAQKGSKSKKVETKVVLKDDEESKDKPKKGDTKFELSKIKGKKAEIEKQKDVEKILKAVESQSLKVSEVKKKVTKKYPKPPFITSTLQQTAVNMYGMTAKRTMMAAQKLYERGFITYMRTDSINMSKDAITAARGFIAEKYGGKYLPEKEVQYKGKSKSAQEAHECIRPVDFKIETDKAFTTDDMKKIYRLIRNRALSSQMTPAKIENVTVLANPEKADEYEFKATGQTVVFDGFMKVFVDKATKENLLPEIDQGDVFAPSLIQALQHFTQPPARYSEASLIKKLEELGIGRPSTYASIIGTIISRKYVEKEGRYLFPTDTGVVVNKLLTKYFDDIVDYDFTSEMEDKLDKIAEGKEDWVKMLKDFYFPFEKNIEEKTEDLTRDEFKILGDAPKDIKCPECGSPMHIKLGKYGRFYSCTKWPDCKGMMSIEGETKEDIENKVKTKEFQESYEPAPKTEDGRDYLLKKGRFGEFWAHPDYPKVKDAQPLKYTKQKERELFGKAPKTDDGKDYLLRSGKYGYFWAHPDYPKVKDVKKAKKKEEED